MEILNPDHAHEFARAWLRDASPTRAARHIAHAAKSADRCANLTPSHSPGAQRAYRHAAAVLRGYLDAQP